MSKVSDPPKDEKSQVALLMIDESISVIRQSENELRHDLKSIQSQMRLNSHPTRKKAAILKELIQRGRLHRKNLEIFQRKRLALENHKSTLETSTINQQVLSTVKHTSAALKSMGLEESMQSVDKIMLEMEEATSDVSMLNKDLSVNFSSQEPSDGDIDLEKELELFLNDDYDSIISFSDDPIDSKSRHETMSSPPSQVQVDNQVLKNSMQTQNEIDRTENMEQVV